MAVEAKYFGRKYRLELQLSKGGKKIVFETKEGRPAMDIKFDVSYARGQTAREGTVSVLGLSKKTITEVIALAAETRGFAMSKLVRVKLEAGYFTSASMVEIFDGYAWYATVTAPPQMWLNIKVCEYNPLGGIAVSIGSVTGTNLKQVVECILKKFEGRKAENEKFKLVDKTQSKLLKVEGVKKLEFPAKMTLKSALELINQNASDKVCFTLRTFRAQNGCRIVEALDKNTELATKGTVEVDGKHGLLSVTGIDAVNGCITTFLDGTVPDELAHLKLKSELNPQANGTYYIVKKQYVGHFMGQEWYTRYFCSARKKTK